MEQQSPLKEKLSRFTGARRGKLSQLSAMMITIGSFKLDSPNVNNVEEMLAMFKTALSVMHR